jgi:hypothetical protein
MEAPTIRLAVVGLGSIALMDHLLRAMGLPLEDRPRG